MVEKRFYRPDELAGVLQVTVRLIYRWIKIGRIRAIPVGDLWRIPSSEYNRATAEGITGRHRGKK